MYETLQFLVTADGIENVTLYCPYLVSEALAPVEGLQSFQDVMPVFEQMMLVQNKDILEYENYRTYHIDRITLGYMRIYDPQTDSRKGTLIPVWDFFGEFSLENKEDGSQYTNTSQNQSFMTINAIDGSVIDRELGY